MTHLRYGDPVNGLPARRKGRVRVLKTLNMVRNGCAHQGRWFTGGAPTVVVGRWAGRLEGELELALRSPQRLHLRPHGRGALADASPSTKRITAREVAVGAGDEQTALTRRRLASKPLVVCLSNN